MADLSKINEIDDEAQLQKMVGSNQLISKSLSS